MNAKIIDGKQLAANLRGEIAAGVAALKNDKGVTPGLAVILVGENPTIWGTALPVCAKRQPPGPSSTALPGFTSTL